MDRKSIKKAFINTQRKLGKPGAMVGNAIGKGLLPKRNLNGSMVKGGASGGAKKVKARR